MDIQNKNIKVLIVEDNRIIALDIKESLEEFGFNVVGTVSRGEKALSWFSSNYCDVVIMDINLEGRLNGLETAKYIIEDIKIPIVIISAQTDDYSIQFAKEIGIQEYITKPASPEQIANSIKRVLNLQ